MSVKCGNCKDYHDSALEVRNCYGLLQRPLEHAVPDSSVPAWYKPADATPKQKNLIMQLINERVLVAGSELSAQAEAGLEGLTKTDASKLIDELFLLPKVTVSGARDKAAAHTAPTHEVPNGTYTVVLSDDDDYVTLKVDEGAKWADGQTVVSFLSGSDNDIAYTGFAFLTDSGLKVWKRFREESRPIAAAQVLLTGSVDEAHERFLDMAEAYAMASGKCMRCARTLTVPASLHRGLGPVCAGIEGV